MENGHFGLHTFYVIRQVETGNFLWSSAFSQDAPAAAFVRHQIFLLRQQQANNFVLTVRLPIKVHSGIIASSGSSPKFHPNLVCFFVFLEFKFSSVSPPASITEKADHQFKIFLKLNLKYN